MNTIKRALAGGPLSMPDLAAACGYSKGHTARLLRHLVAAGRVAHRRRASRYRTSLYEWIDAAAS